MCFECVLTPRLLTGPLIMARALASVAVLALIASETAASSNQCDSLGDHQYKCFSSSKKQSDDRSQCQSWGGDLASFDDSGDISILKDHGENFDKDKTYWMGLTETSSKTYAYTDGSGSYANWDNGEPNGWYGKGNEVSMGLRECGVWRATHFPPP